MANGKPFWFDVLCEGCMHGTEQNRTEKHRTAQHNTHFMHIESGYHFEQNQPDKWPTSTQRVARHAFNGEKEKWNELLASVNYHMSTG